MVVVTAPSHRPAFSAVEAAAQRLGVQVLTVPVRTPEDLNGAFAMMVRERVNGFLAVSAPLLRSQRAVLTELSLKHRLTGMFGPKEHVEAGGLMSYLSDLEDTTRRAATYIDRILKGAKPADLPVEQASKYELYDARGWRATFHRHQKMSADCFATDDKPWRAVYLRHGRHSNE